MPYFISDVILFLQDFDITYSPLYYTGAGTVCIYDSEIHRLSKYFDKQQIMCQTSKHLIELDLETGNKL